MDTNRAFANLERRLTASVGHRADLQFADARRIDKITAKFMLTYTEDKNPTAKDINDFFIIRDITCNLPIRIIYILSVSPYRASE